jgi:recombination protein RecT
LIKAKPKFSEYIEQPDVREMVIKTLGNKAAANRLLAALASAITTNVGLKGCDPKAILLCAFKGESLGLLPLPQLGHYYIIPYGKDVQFQMGYKGYIQLAINSGQFKHINCTPIKSGELVSWNPVSEEAVLEFKNDPDSRDKLETIGYFGTFELMTGFKKSVFWTVKQIQDHAVKFSKNTSNTFWGKNFDAMGRKTVLKSMLSTYGAVAPSIARAVEADTAIVGGEDEADTTPKKK